MLFRINNLAKDVSVADGQRSLAASGVSVAGGTRPKRNRVRLIYCFYCGGRPQCFTQT